MKMHAATDVTVPWRRILSGLAALALVLGIGAGTSTAAVQDLEKAQKALQEGLELLEDERAEEALDRFDETIAIVPDVWQAHYHRGRALGMLGKPAEARDAFVTTTELDPTFAPAYQLAAISAFEVGDFDTAWEMAIIAHQMGIDMSQGFEFLKQASREPDGFQERLTAPRVYVSEQIDAEGLLGREVNPFGQSIDRADPADASTGGGPGAPSGGAADAADSSVLSSSGRAMTSSSRATNTGQTRLSETQAELADMLRYTREAVAHSQRLALAPQAAGGQYILYFEVDDMEDDTPRKLDGYVKLVDATTGEEVYRRVLELRDVSSRGDLNADLRRYVGYLAAWFEDNRPH